MFGIKIILKKIEKTLSTRNNRKRICNDNRIDFNIPQNKANIFVKIKPCFCKRVFKMFIKSIINLTVLKNMIFWLINQVLFISV